MITMISLVYHLGYGPQGVSLVLLADTIPRLLGPFAGSFTDRWNPKRLMAICDAIQVALFAAVALTTPSLPGILVAVAAGALLNTLYRPAAISLLPRLVAPAMLVRANSLLAVGYNIGLAGGPLAGGLLIVGVGPYAGLWVNAASFLLAALLLWGIPPMGRSASERLSNQSGGTIVLGLKEVFHSPVLRTLTIGLFALIAIACLGNAAIVFLAQDVLNGGPAGYGLLTFAYGAGMIIAPLATSAVRSNIRPRTLLYLGELGFGVGTLFTAVAPNITAAAGTLALAGAGNGLENAATESLVQRHAPAARIGVVYGTVYSAMALGGLLSYSIAGVVVAWLGARGTYVVCGGGVLIVLLILFLALRLPDHRSPVPQQSVPTNGPEPCPSDLTPPAGGGC